MRVKKTCRKKNVLNEEKENLTCMNDNETQSVLYSKGLQNTSHIINKSIVDLINEKEKPDQFSTTNELTVKENLSTQPEYDNLLPLNCITNENEENDPLFFENPLNTTKNKPSGSQSCRGQKRKLEQHIDSNEKENRSHSLNDESESDIRKLKKMYIELEARIKKCEETWMRQPQHPDVGQCFTGNTNTLHNDTGIMDIVNDATISNVANDIFLIGVMKKLGMDNNQLAKCNKKTATATVRSIIKFIYPNPELGFKYTQVNKSIIDGAIEYTKFSNPFDTSSSTDLRRAISNYFSSLVYQRKIKSMGDFKRPYTKNTEEQQ